MSKFEQKVFEIADGDIDVWADESGAIFLKVRTKFDDPVELGERDALALAHLLIGLVDQQHSSP